MQDAYPGVAAVVRDLVADFFEKCLEMADDASRHGGDAYERYAYACAEHIIANPQIRMWSRMLGRDEVLPMVNPVRDKSHGRIRADIQRSDLDGIRQTMARMIDITGDAAPAVCRRWLALMLAGMRPGAEVLGPPATDAGRR